MLAIPFTLEDIPADHAVETCHKIIADRPRTAPVLLGDADVFSTEWAESVDEFEDPGSILAEAETIDVDAWFKARNPGQTNMEMRSGTLPNRPPVGGRVLSKPLEMFLAPVRLARWAVYSVPLSRSRSATGADAVGVGASTEALRVQLAELETTGEATEDELCEIREVIAEIEADDAEAIIFPDPVDYVTPRRSATMAAGLIETDAPWKVAAWLQHGTYTILAPKPVLVAYCRWLWERHGARIITASTDHLGFEVARPLETEEDAREVLSRFFALCADELNAEHRGTDGSSLVGATRWWVWWD